MKINNPKITFTYHSTDDEAVEKLTDLVNKHGDESERAPLIKWLDEKSHLIGLDDDGSSIEKDKEDEDEDDDNNNKKEVEK